MAKRKRATNANTIKQREKEGRGKGEGKNYKPYLNIQDVASSGIRPRFMGIKTGRMHQYMSKNEEDYHWTLEAAPSVIDIREQWPLDLERTEQIAELMNITHPYDRKTGHLIVMTTDFFITLITEDGVVYIARTFKPLEALNQRTCEKFEIERLYYEMIGIDWGIVTEHEIPMAISENFRKLSRFISLENYEIAEQEVQMIEGKLYPRLLEEKEPLRKLTAWCDTELGFNSNKSLTVVKHFIASGKWEIDLQTPFDTTKILHLV